MCYFFLTHGFGYSQTLSPEKTSQRAFVEGYVTAVLDAILEPENYILAFDGRYTLITISSKFKSMLDEQKLLKSLRRNQAIKFIKIRFSHELSTNNSQGQVLPVTDKSGWKASQVKPKQKSSVKNEVTENFFPVQPLLQSIVADPRWPRFSVGLQKHFKQKQGAAIYNFSFGENIPIYRSEIKSLLYEIGVQAGLFGAMDMSYKNSKTGEATRLLNSDYTVGIGLTSTGEYFQHFIQYSHLSAHLGDEFLVSQPILLDERINLSYETLKWLCAIKINSIRPYVSVSYMVRKEPSYIKPLTIALGFDYRSRSTFLNDMCRPIFGLHTHHREQHNFRPTVSVVGGVQFENPMFLGRKLEFIIEYANGFSRDGQLFVDRSHYLGFAIRLST